jgi:hypothetical protein
VIYEDVIYGDVIYENVLYEDAPQRAKSEDYIRRRR